MAEGTKLAQYSVGLREFLGQGIHKTSIVSSALLAAISLFYVFSLGSYLQLIVYYFLWRVSYIKPFNDYIVSRYFDSIIISSVATVWLVLSVEGKVTRILVTSIFGILLVIGIVAHQPGLMTFLELATLPVILFILFFQKRYQKRYQTSKERRQHKRNEVVRSLNLSLTLNYLLIIAIILGIYSILISLLVISAFQPISVENIFTTNRIPIDNYGYEVFILFSAFSPLLLIVIFFCIPVKLLIKTVFQRIPGFGKKWWSQSEELTLPEKPHPTKWRVLYLSLFVLFSITLALIPQLSAVNKDNQQIGSDSETYAKWIGQLQQANSVQEFVETAFRGDRPLTLIFLFLLITIIEAPVLDTIEYLPVILGPALVLVIYFLTRELTSNETTSLFAASLTGLGYFQVSMGIYAGFYANWIALLVGYLSLIFFFRFLRTANKVSLLIFFILLLAVLFSHGYTWVVITIVMSIFLVVSLLLKSYPRGKTILLLLVVMASVAFDVIKTVMIESLGSAGGVKLAFTLAQSSIGLKELGLVWDTLVDATQHHYGGILCNVIILGLVIYWLIRSNLRTDFNMFIVVFLMIGIPPLLLGDWIVQSRVFYNIPFQIPAAIALTYISRQKNAFKFLLPIYMWLVAISIWTASNFYEIMPS